MGVCTFIAADWPLPTLGPSTKYFMDFSGTQTPALDDDTDDTYRLYPFQGPRPYTDMEYAVVLDWPRYTKGRALQIIEHIKYVLQYTDCVELWHVFLGSEQPPIVQKAEVPIDELLPQDLQELDSKEFWTAPVHFTDAPTFSCLKVIR